MSYQIFSRGATRQEVKDELVEKMAKVVESQPIHAKDQEQSLAAGSAFVDILPDANDGQDYAVTISGSVTWSNGENDEQNILSASVSVGASLVNKL